MGWRQSYTQSLKPSSTREAESRAQSSPHNPARLRPLKASSQAGGRGEPQSQHRLSVWLLGTQGVVHRFPLKPTPAGRLLSTNIIVVHLCLSQNSRCPIRPLPSLYPTPNYTCNPAYCFKMTLKSIHISPFPLLPA